MDGILAFPLNLALGVKKNPGIDPAIILAGNLLAHRLATFVVNENIGFPIKIDILLDPHALTSRQIASPQIYLDDAMRADHLTDTAAFLAIIKAHHKLS